MSEKAPETASIRIRGPHELRVAVFDLSKRALVSPNFTQPVLFQDFEPYNENGGLAITHEMRATTLGRRIQGRGDSPTPILPAMDVLGRLSSEDEAQLTGYAVVARDAINFRNFSAGLRHFDILDVYQEVQKEVAEPESTCIDIHDAKLLISGFKHIRELSNLIASTSAR